MSEEQPKLTYYQKNKEKCLAAAKEYNKANREKQRAYWKIYYQENKAELSRKRMEYARKNKERIYEKHRTIYYKRHQEKKKKEVQTPLPVLPAPVISPVEEEPRWNIRICPGGVVTFE